MNKHIPRNRSGSTSPMHFKKAKRRARSRAARQARRENRA
jgi:hypothetical protein